METVLRINKHIQEALAISTRLSRLADEGEAVARDDTCLGLYGMVRECARKIRDQAERERDAHVVLGIWDGPDSVRHA